MHNIYSSSTDYYKVSTNILIFTILSKDTISYEFLKLVLQILIKSNYL